ncbi:hypothetical protein [Motilibacter deserti]|uniref:Lactococcin 972 family bacteriocin n=1 Tax=Motilibacter deserti TaxID=2714956 RepID=A0ABX0GUC6_9ACTN|nr:hypothetical protein [Motilibacter deserti]NHC14517.1 hypothetical protein [Motilibacter deserti]
MATALPASAGAHVVGYCTGAQAFVGYTNPTSTAGVGSGGGTYEDASECNTVYVEVQYQTVGGAVWSARVGNATHAVKNQVNTSRSRHSTSRGGTPTLSYP